MAEVLHWAYANGRITASASEVRSDVGDQQRLLYLDDAQSRITLYRGSFGIKPTKGSGCPCVEVTWYGAVAYCSFHSEMEGLTPCYDLNDWSCDWTDRKSVV